MSAAEEDHAIVAGLQARSQIWTHQRPYGAFEPGARFVHHWGRTITAAENSLFATQTLHFNPRYYNADFARAEGHPDVVICPMLVFGTVFGLSVQDLSEAGGFFLGVDDLRYERPVYPGDTLSAQSEVLSTRESERHDWGGIVSWQTEGFNQNGERVIRFRRTNMVKKKVASE